MKVVEFLTVCVDILLFSRCVLIGKIRVKHDTKQYRQHDLGSKQTVTSIVQNGFRLACKLVTGEQRPYIQISCMQVIESQHD